MIFRLLLCIAGGISYVASPLLAAELPSAASWSILTVSGERHESKTINIAHQNWLLGRGEQLKKFETDQILSVSVQHEQPLSKLTSDRGRGCRVSLSNGDRYFGQLLDFTAAAVVISPGLVATEPSNPPSEKPPLSIPLEYIVDVQWFTNLTQSMDNMSARRVPTTNQDLLTLSNGDRITGELTDFSQNMLTLKTENGTREILIEKIDAVRFNPELIISPPQHPTNVLLRLREGSRITAQAIELVDFNQLLLTTSFSQPWRISLQHLKSLLLLNGQRVPLSTRQPANVQYTPFLSTVPNWKADTNVLGGSITMQSAEYLTGLGVQSQTELTWNLDEDDQSFLAEIGLDDVTQGEGSVQFVVLTDGEIAFESGLVRGATPPQLIHVDLAGKQTLTLRVTFGDQGDVQDRANWGHAIILKAEDTQ